MSPPPTLPDSSTPRGTAIDTIDSSLLPGEEEFALGCECANPQLQIECWQVEAAAQPLQQFY
jgi:hypothetical protein